MKDKLYFRADGNHQIGHGHLMRLVAMAEMLQGEYEIIFLIQASGKALQPTVSQVADAIHFLPDSVDFVNEAALLAENFLASGEILVLDGYHFSTDYQQILKRNGVIIVYVDDLHHFLIPADVVINHAQGVNPSTYQIASYSRLYIGAAFALLREVFLEKSMWMKVKSHRQGILICFGGADTLNLTGTILKACMALQQLPIHVIIGASYQYQEELFQLVGQSGHVHIHRQLPSAEIAQMIADVQLAICPASTISYEVCAIGCGLVTGFYVDNQRDIAQFLERENLAINAGNLASLTTEELLPIIASAFHGDIINKHIQKQRDFFDGGQKERIRTIFSNLVKLKNLAVRKATKDDLLLCFSWANDPVIRKQAIDQSTISLQEHTHWFIRKIQATKSYFYILFQHEEPVGQVRFDEEGNYYLVSYAVDQAFRGRGFGGVMLQKAIQQLASEENLAIPLCAWVKMTNEPSMKIFRNLNFREETVKEKDGIFYQVFSKNK